MKTFVQYGAGNIGRGFIGQVFSEAGYAVQFIDVNQVVIDALNAAGRYPVRILSNHGETEVWIEGVSGIDGIDTEAVISAIANADLMATAVGVHILPKIVPNLVAGIKRRMQEGNDKPLNLIICENLIDADKLLHQLISAQLNESELRFFDEHIGLVEASIGRMVPIMTEEMKEGNPLRVCVERYCELPVDKAAWKGEIPDVKHLFPYAPFEFYIKRKLYLHNMGHCLTAFLGARMGYEYIWQAIAHPVIKVIVQRAMTESSVALSKRFDVDIASLLEHVADLMLRFANVALGDTNERVGKDIVRKLSPEDRFIGTMKMMESLDMAPVYVALGVALGLRMETNDAQEASLFLENTCKISTQDAVFERVTAYYQQCDPAQPMEHLLRIAEERKEGDLQQKIMI